MKLHQPHKACDADLDKVVFPVIVMPKIDGVRGVNYNGELKGRTLKPIANHYVRTLLSQPEFIGFDGELAAGPITAGSLCRDTVSALNSHDGIPPVSWNLFDYLGVDAIDLEYQHRLQLLKSKVAKLRNPGLSVIEHDIAHSMAELSVIEERHLAAGFEGVILRNPHGPHKNGRSTATSGDYLRLKRFIEEDAVVLSLVEAQTNSNPRTTNELGKAARSSHKVNKSGNGMLGSLLCRDVKTGQDIEVSAGSMDHEQRRAYWKYPEKLVGEVIKYKHFPRGRKDKPRFPTFQAVRPKFDL